MVPARPLWQFARMQTTDDGFLGGRLRLLQPKKGFRAGVDSVFLAASIPAATGESAIEAGTGPGVAACCLLARVRGLSLAGVEREAAYVELARENARRNSLALDIHHADFSRALDFLPAGYHHAFANPPFFADTAASPSPHALKARAHAFGSGDMAIWVRVLASLLAHGGSLTLINRWEEARAIAEAMAANDMRSIHLLPILARAGQAPIRAILQARKATGSASERMLEGFVLHCPTGHGFTPQAEAILREGQGLQLSV